MKILVLNAGSSSLKYQLFEMPDSRVITSGLIEQIGEKGSNVQSHQEAIKIVFDKLIDPKNKIIKDLSEVNVVGHRVVHGGEAFHDAVLIDENVRKEIKQCIKLAPLHNPANLAGIEAIVEFLPNMPQVAVFDTAFHQTIPIHAFLYALPYELYKKYKIRRYGFHGISHQYVAIKAAKKLKKPLEELKLVTCHLGNGCSISAVLGGQSVDTSMGFTPLEGLVMGTRSGDIDPAIVSFLMEQEKYTHQEVNTLLNKKSGLLGISGISNDVRSLLEAAENGDQRAMLALDIFSYRVKKYIGAYTFAMNGVDAIIFTGGIGEHANLLREKITKGIFQVVDPKKTQVLVVPTNEELMIAQEAFALTSKKSLRKRKKIKRGNKKSKKAKAKK